MAKRAWVVRPDSEITGIGPEGDDVVIPAVSLEALAGAVLEGVTIMHRAGGVVSVLASRVPTGFPNERVTNAAIVEWKDRTDARPQPEADGPPIAVEPAATAAAGSGRGRRARIEQLAERDGWECHLCGEPLELAADGPLAITFDHLVPRSQGGGSGLDNLALAHWECNNARGNAPLAAEADAPVAEPEAEVATELPAVDESSVPAPLREA